jgi:tRNA pseudouridine38-40 synthase
VQRYFLQLSYNGTAYHGWQVQENTALTVQGVVNEVCSRLLNEAISTTGCGRTDAGVHARVFYAHFDSVNETLLSEQDQWIYKFNKALPADIAVQKIMLVKPDASARFDATSRSYQYFISKVKNPFRINETALLKGTYDIETMNQAANLLLDYEDFSAFSKSNTQTYTNNCKIYSAHWTEDNDMLIFSISADRFLRNMVRAIVGTLLNVGAGKLSVADFAKVIESKNRSNAGTSVDACGLYLVNVTYPKAYFDVY